MTCLRKELPNQTSGHFCRKTEATLESVGADQRRSSGLSDPSGGGTFTMGIISISNIGLVLRSG